MRVFVAWDFVDPAARALLEGVARYAESERSDTWVIPGINNPRASGIIGSDIVARSVREAEVMVALVDRANANVGWEIGLAIGLGKQLRLASIHPNPQLTGGVLDGVLVTQVAQFQQFCALPSQDNWSFEFTATDSPDKVMCVLCPGGPEGSVLKEGLRREGIPGLHLFEPASGKSGGVRASLSSWQHVIWVVAMEADDTARDGVENASNAVIAGLARGAKIPVTVLISAGARRLVDVTAESIEFEGVDGFLQALRLQYAVSRPQRLADPAPTLKLTQFRDRPRLTSELQRMFRHRGTILEIAARVGIDSLPERLTPDQCWGEIMRSIHNGHGDVGPLVQAGLEVEPKNQFFLELAARCKTAPSNS